MISALLKNKIDAAYAALDDVYVQATQDSFLTFDKKTIQVAKQADRCIVILEKFKNFPPISKD